MQLPSGEEPASDDEGQDREVRSHPPPGKGESVHRPRSIGPPGGGRSRLRSSDPAIPSIGTRRPETGRRRFGMVGRVKRILPLVLSLVLVFGVGAVGIAVSADSQHKSSGLLGDDRLAQTNMLAGL